jgi:hypothetical protein
MLKLDLDISMTRKDGELQLALFDCTGIYDATINPTGFGAPNLDIANISVSTLQIVFPCGEVYNIDSSAFLPNLDGQYIYLTFQQVTGNAGQYVDGEYTFTYIIEDDTVPTAVRYTYEESKFFYCNIECCIKNKAANIDLNACECEEATQTIEETSLAWIGLKSLQSQVCLGQMVNAKETLLYLQKICNINLDCSC